MIGAVGFLIGAEQAAEAQFWMRNIPVLNGYGYRCAVKIAIRGIGFQPPPECIFNCLHSLGR